MSDNRIGRLCVELDTSEVMYVMRRVGVFLYTARYCTGPHAGEVKVVDGCSILTPTRGNVILTHYLSSACNGFSDPCPEPTN